MRSASRRFDSRPAAACVRAAILGNSFTRTRVLQSGLSDQTKTAEICDDREIRGKIKAKSNDAGTRVAIYECTSYGWSHTDYTIILSPTTVYDLSRIEPQGLGLEAPRGQNESLGLGLGS